MESMDDYVQRINHLIESGATTMEVLESAKGWRNEVVGSDFIILTSLKHTHKFSMKQLHEIKAWFMDMIPDDEIADTVSRNT